MKEIIKKLVVGFMATALATYYFTGCSQATEPTDSIPDLGYATTEEANPGIDETETTDTDTFSIKYKYWYDNPEVTEAQTDAKLNYDLGNWTETEDYFLDLVGLPIYVNADTNDQFIFSGRTPIFLHDNKISARDSMLLRDSNGYKLYFTLSKPTEELLNTFAAKLSDNDAQQPETYEDRVNRSDTITVSDETEYSVFVNNIETEVTFSSSSKLNISSLLELLNLGVWLPGNNEMHLYTASGEITVHIQQDAGAWKLTYSTEDKETTASSEAIEITDSSLLMTVDAIEDYLGYDVEIYNDFINIVTDNKDIITLSSVLPLVGPADITDPTPGIDTTKPISDTANQEAINTYNEAKAEAEEKAQEQQEAFEEMTATPEQEAEAQQDKQERQEMADDTASYTTEGIPLTTNGDLAEPAKPTASYKLPANAQLTFSGDASTALTTTLPEGCYWTPGAYCSENAYTDPAGNVWLNNKHPETTGAWLIECGYYSPDGRYHATQEEIDHAEALNAAIHDINVNGPTNGEGSTLTDEEAESLAELFGF